MPKLFRSIICSSLPLEVRRAGTAWRIAVGGDDRGGHRLLATRLSDRADFVIYKGSQRDVDKQLRNGLNSKPGTIRHDLFVALAASGRAVMREVSE